MAPDRSDYEHPRIVSLALGEALSDEWSDEGCAWSMRFEGAAGTSDPWCVSLERWMENDVPHHADFMRLTWQFWGGSPVDALTEALSWVRGLEAWRPCSECDGFGWWGRVPDRKPCDECHQTGLAAHAPHFGRTGDT